jgi:hypothetical protein
MVKGRYGEDIMHPMFVKLFLEPDEDDQLAEERRRSASRARRLQSRAVVKTVERKAA